ncbi:hypothetical protein [Glutamicibacter sp. TV12E]|uniref:hypothetical protein n=1 Tax=Glutamicibacter sp. TV12E TaxID=3446362 RepID=UPI004034702E
MITGTRILPERSLTICQRCGIEHTPGHSIEGSRADYCTDCRPIATELGWCNPKTRRKQAVAA